MLGLIKDELGGKIITDFAALRPKPYSYLLEGGKNNTHVTKKKGMKKRVMKRIIDYKDCLLNNEIMLKSQQRFRIEAHNI